MISYFKKLTTHTVIYGFGDMMARALSFILLPLFTRTLTAEDYGVYSILQTLQLVMVIIVSLGAPSAFLRSFHSLKDASQQRRLLSTTLYVMLSWGALILGLMAAFSGNLSVLLFQTADYALLLQWMVAAIFMDVFRLVGMVELRANEKPMVFSIFNVLYLAILLPLNILMVVVWEKGLAGYVQSQFIASTVMGLLVFAIVVRPSLGRLSLTMIRPMMQFGLPLVPNALAIWVLSMSAQNFIRHYCPGEEVGFFGAAMRFGMVINMLLARPFRTAWMPFLFSIRDESNANRIYSLTLTFFWIIGLSLLLPLTLFRYEIITLSTTLAYGIAADIIPVIGFSYILFGLYNILDVGILLTGKTTYYIGITSTAALLQVALNFIFVPRYGMIGAAVSMALSYLYLCILVNLISQKLLAVKYDLKRILVTALLFALAVVLGTVTNDLNHFLSIGIRGALVLLFPAAIVFGGVLNVQEKKAMATVISGLRGRRNTYLNPS